MLTRFLYNGYHRLRTFESCHAGRVAILEGMHRFSGIFLPLVIIIAAFCVGGYSGYQAYVMHRLEQADSALQQQQLANNKEKLREALSGVKGLSQLAIERGFWYTLRDSSGNDSVYYFDFDGAAARGLSDSQIAQLASHIASSTILGAGTVDQVAENELPPNLQFHNSLYASAFGGTSTIAIGNALNKKVSNGSASSQDLLQASYLAELNGDYASRDQLNAQNCAQFKVRCADLSQIKIVGRVVDSEGAAIEGATVDITSRPDAVGVKTDAKGMYAISVGSKDMEKMRIHARKRNFSDGYSDITVLEGVAGKRTYTVDDIELDAPIGIVTIDYVQRSVTGLGNVFHSNGSVTITTSRSTYDIPKGAIVHADGSPYTGNTVDVYLYEFSKGNPPPNLTQLDTFDQVRGYAGNLMKSFGMPYIQFFSENGEELHVLRSNPMVLTYKIADMDALRSNTDHIYRALTDADMQLLVQASAGQPYRIDRQFLIDNQMLQFPAFWVFDRKRGVWDNVGVSVLDTQGTIKTIFYTIRDGV